MEHIRAMENIIFVGNFWKLIINFHFTFRKFEDRLSIISRCKLFLEILRIFFILWLVWDLIAESKASKTVILISQISLLIQNLTFPNSLNRRFFRARDLGIKTQLSRNTRGSILGVEFKISSNESEIIDDRGSAICPPETFSISLWQVGGREEYVRKVDEVISRAPRAISK